MPARIYWQKNNVEVMDLIKITADSTCDLSPQIIREMDITLAPLYIVTEGKSYRDGIDITPADIFRLIDTEKKRCQTTAVNQFDYQQLFQNYASLYEAVIHFNIGTHFSACHQNASLAAQAFSNVYVIDTCNLSTGSGYLVYDAALMARDGKPIEEIITTINKNIALMDCSFVIDRVDYLHKGGRCSGLESFGARILNIKPSIEVADGKMRVGKKYRGSFALSLEKYVHDRLAEQNNIDYKRVFITHSVCAPGIVGHVREYINRYATFEEVVDTYTGCTVSNHCGPGTLGIIYKHK